MKFRFLLLLFLIGWHLSTTGTVKPSASVYTLKPSDSEAVFFTPEAFGIKADGKTDVSEALQKAINQVKTQQNFGVLFIPEGKYLISKTIYVPGAIRLIGYGKSRPEIILGKNTPGFQEKENFMIWFTGGIVEEGRQPNDAGAGTFYSAISNIDMRIENGNPKAIALRTHFAQHGFVSHCDLNIGNGMAGIYDVGNEMEDVNFYGGEYGITTSRTSPGWPMMMVDLYFEGQRKAAILTKNAGLTIVSMQVKNTPTGIELPEDIADRLYMENCLMENVGKAIVIGVEDNATNQINLVNIDCKNVPVIAYFTKSAKGIEAKDKMYKIKDFTYGLVMKDMNDDSKYRTICDTEPLSQVPVQLVKDIPSLPAMDSWVNIKDLGAKGDCETDDTKAFQEAIAKYKNIYVPTGWYRLTETIKMAQGTKLIGMHPFATQLILKESEPAFSGFGAPKPLLESSEGGDDIVNGIGLNTGAYNNRAVGLKWMAGEKSMINDVKFVGGHGTMRKPNAPVSSEEPRRRERKISSPDSPENAIGMDLAWDNQYWSLWVTNGGGGTLKDIWTANTYAGVGFYASNTSTPASVYAMSLEHHVRYECRMDRVSNWKLYAFQFEEESREGKDCQSLEMNACKDIRFANFWMYRVIRVNTPRHWGIRVSDCQNIDFRNMRNWTQVLHVPELTVYDMNKNLAIYPWDFARATITGNEKGNKLTDSQVEKLAFGFEFATGAVADSKGNVYFCENRLKKIYKWSVETNTVSVYADYPYKPFSMAVDTKDNLLVICRYDPQPGLMVDGKQESVSKLPDDNPMYSGWGNGGWAALAYAINPEKADDMQPLKKVKTSDISNVKRVIYPTHRWRTDFDKVAQSMPENSFLAPDGVTIIPETYDLGRSVELMAVVPGQTLPAYVSHEDNKTTYRFEVDKDGKLIHMQKAFPRGEYGSAVDTDGTLYLAEGQIFVFDKNGKEIKRINLDERPISMAIGGKDKNLLFVTTSASIYKVKIN
ncbi:MAG: glycosyl hydrolase family 28-related protein [Methylococcaceae bacterium]